MRDSKKRSNNPENYTGEDTKPEVPVRHLPQLVVATGQMDAIVLVVWLVTGGGFGHPVYVH